MCLVYVSEFIRVVEEDINSCAAFSVGGDSMTVYDEVLKHIAKVNEAVERAVARWAKKPAERADVILTPIPASVKQALAGLKAVRSKASGGEREVVDDVQGMLSQWLVSTEREGIIQNWKVLSKTWSESFGTLQRETKKLAA